MHHSFRIVNIKHIKNNIYLVYPYSDYTNNDLCTSILNSFEEFNEFKSFSYWNRWVRNSHCLT